MYDKFFSKHLLPKFQKIFDANQEEWINKKHLTDFDNHELNVNQALDDYKRNHHKPKYYLIKYLALPLSIIPLAIPFYWTFKKYKELEANRKQLVAKINHSKKSKLDLHAIMFDNIDWLNIFKEFNGIIPYKNYGPVCFDLIEQIKAHSLFVFDDPEINTLNTSWGILDNSIVIHSAKQRHKKYMRTYTGSTQVSYWNSRTKQNDFETVYATYQHEAFAIDSVMHSYMFMTSCNDLTFEFKKESNKLTSKFFNRKNKYSPLENKKFDNEFNWHRSNDAQFRMIFTALAQEQYLEAVNISSVQPEYQWQKEGSFIFNQTKSPITIGNIVQWFNHYQFKFLVNPDMTDEQFKQEIFAFIVGFYHEIYCAHNYYWITSVLQSEDHSSITKDIINHKLTEADYYLYFHYVLNDILKVKAVVSSDMDTFHTIKNYELVNIGSHEIFKVSFEGISYVLIEKIKSVPTFGTYSNKLVLVPVHYYDYIPVNGNINILFQIFNHVKHYYYVLNNKVQTNIKDNNLLDILNKYQDNIYLNEGIFACKNIDEADPDLHAIVNFINNNSLDKYHNHNNE